MVDQLGIETITVPMCLRQRGREGLPFCFFFISMAFYNPTSIGFPPLDMELRDWLVSELGDRTAVQNRLHGFIYSLLMVTHERLETIAKEQGDYLPTALRLLANGIADIPELPHLSKEAAKERYREEPDECVSPVVNRQKKLASAFREHMTKGQSYHSSNSDRRTFYEDVTARAKQVNFLSFFVFVRMTVFSSL
jgi:hypothetical protein